MLEEWKKIEYGDGKYEISNLGKIRSNYLSRPPKILSTRVCKNNGYEQISLTYLTQKKTITIHNAVAKAFIRDYDGKKEVVNHKDGNKLNNRIDNLEIIDRKGNLHHACINDLQKTNHIVVYQGIQYRSKTEMRKALHMGETRQNKLIASGEITELTNRHFKNNSITHKVVYLGQEFSSKRELRDFHNMSERKLNKLISEGTIKIL